MLIGIADGKLIPAKTGAGEVDLQARDLRFDDYTFLKKNEKRSGYRRAALGHRARARRSRCTRTSTPTTRCGAALMRDVRFRRALSLAIDRHEINQVVFFGLAQPSQQHGAAREPAVRAGVPRRPGPRFDLKAANALLDEIGLTKRDADGMRLLPDGRPLEIIVETAGESTEQTDVLELIRDSWRQVGIALFSRPSQREVFRNRVFSGRVDDVGLARPRQRPRRPPT